MAAGLNFVGAFISTHVATTIGKGSSTPGRHPDRGPVALAGRFWTC